MPGELFSYTNNLAILYARGIIYRLIVTGKLLCYSRQQLPSGYNLLSLPDR